MKIGMFVLAAMMIGAGAGAADVSTVSAGSFTLKSVRFELPNGELTLPAGAGADTANGVCLACHSAGMITTQPRLPKAAWEATVRKMIAVYKAPIDEADAATVIGYLAALKAPAQP